MPAETGFCEVPDGVEPPEEQPRSGRRSVFRLGLKRIMEPVVDYLEKRLDIPLPVFRVVLRPPGAIPEQKFLQTCYRCGNCVDVCPAKAIRTMGSEDVEQAGTPYIDPDLAACVVCDPLACMKACPSGALRPVASVSAIRMGLARWVADACLRSTGQDCRICLDKCPIGAQAIRAGQNGAIEILASGCVGCGTCQFFCPTLPKALVVDPD